MENTTVYVGKGSGMWNEDLQYEYQGPGQPKTIVVVDGKSETMESLVKKLKKRFKEVIVIN